MNPLTGRFWSMDSYQGTGSDPQSLHKYLYVNADHTNGSDPSGKYTVMETEEASTESAGLSGMASSAVTRQVAVQGVGITLSPAQAVAMRMVAAVILAGQATVVGLAEGLFRRPASMSA
jgi:hypothetical protein